MQNETKTDILPLKSDIVFQRIFGDEANADILRSFLESALSFSEGEFEEITVMDPRLEREFPDDKFGILDVRIKTKAGIFVDVEIQLFRKPYMAERILFYTAKNLVTQLKSGDSYKKIGKSVTILVANYDVFPGEPPYRHSFVMYDPETRTIFTEAFAVHVFELKKLPCKPGMNIKEEALLNWLRLIRSEDLEEIEMLATKSPEMKKTVTIIKKLSADERTRLEYEDREKAMRDYLSLTEDSKEEGRMEGKIEGRIEGKIEGRIEGKIEGRIEGKIEERMEMVKSMLSYGISLETIAEISHLSVDEITAQKVDNQ